MSSRVGLGIKLLREQKRVTGRELAERVGLSQSQISRLESGQRRIDANVLERIAQALEVSPSIFFDRSAERGASETAASRDVGTAVAEAAVERDEESPAKRLGRLIHDERRKRHLSAEELGQEIGKGKTFVLDLEAGATEFLSAEVARRLARALKLEPTVFLEAQHEVSRGLRRRIRLLERELAAGDGREVATAGKSAGSARLIEILEAEGGGLPLELDERGLPAGRLLGTLALPAVQDGSAFAVLVASDDMSRSTAPSFRAGDVVVFTGIRPARHGDFALARLARGAPVFRQAFFEPGDVVRLQPLNLVYAPSLVPSKEVLGLWPLVARVERF